MMTFNDSILLLYYSHIQTIFKQNQVDSVLEAHMSKQVTR